MRGFQLGLKTWLFPLLRLQQHGPYTACSVCTEVSLYLWTTGAADIQAGWVVLGLRPAVLNHG